MARGALGLRLFCPFRKLAGGVVKLRKPRLWLQDNDVPAAGDQGPKQLQLAVSEGEETREDHREASSPFSAFAQEVCRGCADLRAVQKAVVLQVGQIPAVDPGQELCRRGGIRVVVSHLIGAHGLVHELAHVPGQHVEKAGAFQPWPAFRQAGVLLKDLIQDAAQDKEVVGGGEGPPPLCVQRRAEVVVKLLPCPGGGPLAGGTELVLTRAPQPPIPVLARGDEEPHPLICLRWAGSKEFLDQGGEV